MKLSFNFFLLSGVFFLSLMFILDVSFFLGELLLLSSSSDPSSFNDQQMAASTSADRSRAPKLCEIEQFSTETQTDTDFELIRFRNLKRSGSSDNSPTSDVGDDPMFASLMSRFLPLIIYVTDKSLIGF